MRIFSNQPSAPSQPTDSPTWQQVNEQGPALPNGVTPDEFQNHTPAQTSAATSNPGAIDPGATEEASLVKSFAQGKDPSDIKTESTYFTNLLTYEKDHSTESADQIVAGYESAVKQAAAQDPNAQPYESKIDQMVSSQHDLLESNAESFKYEQTQPAEGS